MGELDCQSKQCSKIKLRKGTAKVTRTDTPPAFDADYKKAADRAVDEALAFLEEHGVAEAGKSCAGPCECDYEKEPAEWSPKDPPYPLFVFTAFFMSPFSGPGEAMNAVSFEVSAQSKRIAGWCRIPGPGVIAGPYKPGWPEKPR